MYPQVLLNRIKISDFTFRPGTLSLNEFAGKVRSNSQEIQTMFSWKENSLSYKNYSLSKENISVDEVKSVRSTNGTNSIYIKFKYLNPVSNKVYKGNNWYKVSGFSDTSFETTNSLLFENNNLKTIFDSENSIKRERILEPYYKDTLWSFNKSEEKAFWTLDEKYIRKTLLQDGSRDRKIKVQLFGNLLIQDLKRLTRISGRKRIFIWVWFRKNDEWRNINFYYSNIWIYQWKY
ncbi:hypothetical protein ONA22_01835 [Mycoplasmopsis cynos]|uniref:hypothetical protein n=1 Tax=Mycoplasmopsis cynos TaxID=171284 RepID=UPI0024C7A37E|nr:hypothetical protein [Mycoplasmopsis cynos]WAM03759.1 hypothetical protein ONA22_01835 [Mycoplasmopsis cynos]